MHSTSYRWAAAIAATAAFVLTAAAPPAGAADLDQFEIGAPVIPLKDARLKIEFNATDRDIGVQLFVDAEPWKTMNVFDPEGRLIFSSNTRGSMTRQGTTELFLESGEPSLDEVALEVFLKRFPAGDYRIVGKGIKGEKLVGTARFSHNIPDGPVLVSPAEGAMVDSGHLVIRWQPVAPPNGSPIVGYQVLVVKPNSGLAGLPKIVLDVTMPPSATAMLVPPGFLLPGSAYDWEILAIEAGGNQTLSVRHFQTLP